MTNESQWLAERRKYVTASEVGAILGLGFEGQSALSVWEEKMNPKAREFSSLFYAGQALEDVAAKSFEVETGKRLEDRGRNALLVHPSIPWLACTLDRVIVDSGSPLEIKVMGLGHHVDRHEWKEDPPERQQLQVQIQSACMCSDSGTLLGFFVPGCETITKDITFDDELFSLLVPKLEKFYKHMIDKTPPDPLEFSLGERELKRIYKTTNGKTIALGYPEMQIVNEWQFVKNNRIELEKREKEYKAKLLAIMGENEFGALLDGSFLKRKMVHKDSYVVKEQNYIHLSYKEPK